MVQEIIKSVHEHELGIEVAKNLIIFDSNIKEIFKKKVELELIDILETVHCYLLEVSVGAELINEVLEKYS